MPEQTPTQSMSQIGAPLLTVLVCLRCHFHVRPRSTCVCGGKAVPVTYIRADLQENDNA